MTRTVSRTPLMSLGAAALLTSLLAGCGTASAGAAAVAGDRRISVADVQSATVDLQTWVGDNGQVDQTQVLHLLAIAPYVQDFAVQLGASATEGDAEQAFGTRVPHPSDSAITVLRANISLTTLQQKYGAQEADAVMAESTKRLAKAGFTVNPRYGTFDVAAGRISLLQPKWLVGAEEQTPSTTPAG